MMYISGAISAPTKEEVQKNLRRFREKAEELRKMGWDVFDPGSLEQPGWTWEQYLARDLKFIHENRPIMYMLEGWEESRGARLEYQTALLLNLNICFECHLISSQRGEGNSKTQPESLTTLSPSSVSSTSSEKESATRPTMTSSERSNVQKMNFTDGESGPTRT